MALSDPTAEPLLAAAQAADVALAVHCSFGSTMPSFATGRYDNPFFEHMICHPFEQMAAALDIVCGGVLDRFPKLRVGFFESGLGWLHYWLERMDATFESPLGRSVPLKERPSEYFKRQCWISGDPDERSLAGVIPFVGEDRFFWASDFPHADHPPDYLANLEGLVALLPATARPKVLGQNVLSCYGIESENAAG